LASAFSVHCPKNRFVLAASYLQKLIRR